MNDDEKEKKRRKSFTFRLAFGKKRKSSSDFGRESEPESDDSATSSSGLNPSPLRKGSEANLLRDPPSNLSPPSASPLLKGVSTPNLTKFHSAIVIESEDTLSDAENPGFDVSDVPLESTEIDLIAVPSDSTPKPSSSSSSFPSEDVGGVEGEQFSDSRTREELFHMWGVPDDRRTVIFIEQKPLSIRGATLEKIIEKLTSPIETPEYQHYVSQFFMTFRSFCSPQLLLQKLSDRFFGEGMDYNEIAENDPILLGKVQDCVCKSVAFWINNHYSDFGQNSGLLKQLEAFIQKAKEDSNVKATLIGFIDKLLEKKIGKGTYKSFFEMADAGSDCPPSILPEKEWKSVTFFDLDDLEIARQLTISEQHIYMEIQPVELQDLAWSKAKLKHRAPNVLAMIDQFNLFSSAFTSLIVSAPQLKLRKKIIEKLVHVAELLYEMNSFNMVMAIMSGFGNSAVYRMKHTFASLSKKTTEALEKLQNSLSSNSSYKSYRELISNVKPPCIPFLGVYLTDLTFVEDGNPDKVEGLINFRKRQLEYDVIVQVLKYQNAQYNFKLVPKLTQLLVTLPRHDEDLLYNLSLSHEPRGSKKSGIK